MLSATDLGQRHHCRPRALANVSIEMPLTARAKMVGLFWPKASKSKAKLISCLGAMSTDVNACEELGPPEVLSIHL